MNLQIVGSVIKGNVEAIDQGVRLVSQLSNDQYNYVATPWITSSIGSHVRHILDMYFAIIHRADAQQELADYDVRRRGSRVETDKTQAMVELHEVRDWIGKFQTQVKNVSVAGQIYTDPRFNIKTEVTLEETESVIIPTTLTRELVFASSHAVHHYALISVIARLQNINVDESFGVAPATASYLRDDLECVR